MNELSDSNTERKLTGSEPQGVYRVPLTTGEALATFASLRALHRLLAGHGIIADLDPGILENAAAQIAGELPEFAVDHGERLASSLAAALAEALMAEGEAKSGTLELEKAAEEESQPPFPIGRTRRLLEDAFERGRAAEIEYFVASRNEWTTRRVEISDVYEAEGTWYLSGYCRLRDDFRHFRLDHVRTVRVLDDEDAEGAPDPFKEEPEGTKGSGEQSDAPGERRDRGKRQRKRGGDGSRPSSARRRTPSQS